MGDADGRQIVLSQHTGVVVVRGMPRQLREVESFLKSSKLSIERQVMLEAKIVEVTLKDGYQSGINWTQLNGEGNHRISVGSDPSRIWVPGSVGRQYGVPDGDQDDCGPLDHASHGCSLDHGRPDCHAAESGNQWGAGRPSRPTTSTAC